MRIAIDAGHGLYTPGKRCDGNIDALQTREWTLNQRIANKIQALLSNYENVQTLRVDDTTGQIDIPLISRCKKSNAWGADWYISCHHNAGARGTTAGGLVIYTYVNPSSILRGVQATLYDELIQLTGLKGNRSNPLNTAEFYVLKYTDAKAILIEYGYMDSLIDTPIILTEEFADKAALGTVNGLAKSLNLKRVVANNAPTETEEEMTRDETLALIEQSKERVYHYWDELPIWAKDKIKKLYDNGMFSGRSASDLDLSESMMRTLVILSNALTKANII